MDLFVKAAEKWIADRGSTALDTPLFTVYCNIVMHTGSTFGVTYNDGGREVLLRYYNVIEVNDVAIVDSLKAQEQV